MLKWRGFTIIELTMVIGIIVFLTALILPNYRAGEKQFALQRTAHKIAQDLRRTQEMAMSTREINGTIPNGFGIHFQNSWPHSYKLFADLNNNHHRDGADQDLETIELESEVQILDLSPSLNFSILFAPPDPTVWIEDLPSGIEAQITISLKDDPAKVKIISVNNAGLIAIE